MKTENIFIAGHEGMVGSAIYNDLKKLKKKIFIIKKKKLNLLNQEKIFKNSGALLQIVKLIKSSKHTGL